MSFGPSTTTKTAENNLSGISSTAVNSQLPTEMSAGSNLMGMGNANVQSGTNFLQTLLGGNAANTTAALQPSIDQIRGGTTNTLNAINTLTPRGGGRSGALFAQSFAPQSQIQSLFNNARTTAATALPQIGLQQSGQGANLFGLGNQALQVGTGASTGLGQMGLQQQQMNNQLAAGLGGGLFSLATTPLAGSSSLLGMLAGLLKPGAGTAGSGSAGGGGASGDGGVANLFSNYPTTIQQPSNIWDWYGWGGGGDGTTPSITSTINYGTS